jgi:ADP-heptose:LPS heptosyltransferase
MNKERILLVHLFSNGDCLFATTVARQIKNDFPNCILSWAISEKCKNIIANNPYVDEIVGIEIPDAALNSEIFETTIKEAEEKKKQGYYTQVFVSQVLGDNFAYYDGTVCTSIYRCFGRPITVDTAPVLCLTEAEKNNAAAFALANQLQAFKNIILFECAPQSNQLNLTDEIIFQYCTEILQQGNTCIILSAPKKYGFDHPGIIDGNSLSIRETVALTHHCTLLLGCSSGISWAATSEAAKKIPMVQMLTRNTYIFNPLSITFKKLHQSTDKLIELVNFNTIKLGECFKDIFTKGFEYARTHYNDPVKKQFKLHRGIVSNFLIKGKFLLAMKFIKINIKENGFELQMIKFIMLGVVLSPLEFIKQLKNRK